MRSFVSIVFFMLITHTVYGYANPKTDLFDVRILQNEAADSKKSLDDSLLDAIKIELVRLTGNPEFILQNEAKTFIQNPKAWLKSYRYEPYEQDGVRVGTFLVFEFDQERFYDYFQKQGFVIWPYANRPVTYVMGSQLIAGTLVKLNRQNLSYLPKMDFRNKANQLGLPYEIPSNEGQWIYPDSTDGFNPRIPDLLQGTEASYLLSFQVVSDIDGSERFKWQLFNRNGQSLLQAEASGSSSSVYFEATLQQLMQMYSAPYREQAEFLGSLTLVVKDVTSVERLTKAEEALIDLKPIVHQARLSAVSEKKATFEIVYQGDYNRLLEHLQKIDDLQLIQDDAVIGQVIAKWL
uniref:DUF2066 domain-containing protein n=1 Tax=Hydrogenovibrio crunogenus (strain DSM 25203 / XCL-2) TaxID=317025 RepID=Q31GT1_HYDCU